MRTLALGRRDSAFYRSLSGVLFAFGEMTFLSERDFVRGADAVDYVRREGFDRVLMPNPYGNPARLSCYRALREAGIETVASDRGALPDSWFFDHGFNADSPSYAPEQWDHPLTEEQRAAARSYIAELRGSDAALESQGQRTSRADLERALGVAGKKIVFVPLQRPKDTVVQHFSGPADGLDGFVSLALRIQQRLNEHSDDWRFVFKKHPLETHRPEIGAETAVWAGDGVHVHDLIDLSDAVLVLNSGVGLLSLLFGKPTYHVGRAFYGHEGLARRVTTVEEGARLLGELRPPDPAAVERFLHHLTTRVYSFARSETEVKTEADGALRRVTRTMDFYELRVLGERIPLPEAHVLVVSPVVPWPIYRGSQSRVDLVLRSLSQLGLRVSLCVLNTSSRRSSERITGELYERYPALERIEVRMHPKFARGARKLWWRLVRAADRVSGGPQRIANLDTCPPSFRRAVAQLCEEIRPEYLLVNYAKMTPSIPSSYPGTTILDAHDYQTKFLEEDQQQNRIRRWIHLPTFRASEQRALRQYDDIVAINPLEKDEFQRIAPDARVHCVPAFTDPVAKPEVESHSHDLLFVASMSNFNVTGLRWFTREVLPLVQEELPGLRVVVAGNIDRAKGVDTTDPSLEFLGIVPSLDEVYAASRVVIAPILGGAGMKIKVIEALGHGKALVCTPRAAEGIALVDGHDAMVRGEPRGFAEAVIALSTDDELRRRIETAGSRFHRENHSPGAAREALSRVFPRSHASERRDSTTLRSLRLRSSSS